MSTAKKSLIGLGGGLVLLAAAGGGGFFYGHQQEGQRADAAEARANELETELSEARSATAAETRELRTQLTAEQRRTGLLEARRQLAVALDQIDARNFGLAQQHCQHAAEELGRIEDDASVEGLADQLASYRFEVGGNFDESRAQLRRFARSLDRLVAPSPAGLVEEPASATEG